MARGWLDSLTLFFFLGIAVVIRSVFHFSDFRRYSAEQALKFRSIRDDTSYVNLDETFENIFWFMQISDIHISKFDDNGRTTDFFKLCHSNIPIISPDIVIVSGDITDAKLSNKLGSKQFKDEWFAYKNVISTSGVLNFTKWLDMRGNHDSFNVPSVDHVENYYRQFSRQGRQFAQSYMIKHRKSYGTYSFIGLDACPSPGMKRPYNFFGRITTDLAKMLHLFSEKASSSNLTFWFGHYPTSTIVSPGFDLRNLIGKTAYSYFCGHLHTLHLLAPKLYTIQPQGFFELEVGDWRDSRYYRIVAVDNDLVSFTDEQFHADESADWPIVIVTNPKDAAFLLPNKEPASRILKSSHIRILAWSKWTIRRISVSIDGIYIGEAKAATVATSMVSPNISSGPLKNQPLYVLPWDPNHWLELKPSAGLNAHTIEVVCEDVQKNRRVVKQSFTLDGTTRWNFLGFQSFILLGDQTTTMLVLFYIVWMVPFLALVFSRLLCNSRLYMFFCSNSCFCCGMRIMARSDALFYSLFCYLLYVLCGPTFLGYILDQHFGVVFTFGIFVSNTFLPEGTTYLKEILQQLIFTYPVVIILARHCVGVRRQMHQSRCCFTRCLPLSCLPIVMIFICFLEAGFIIMEVLLPYGWAAFLLSPGRLWLLPLAVLLYRHASRLASDGKPLSSPRPSLAVVEPLRIEEIDQ